MVAFALLHISCVAPTLKLGFLYQHSPASWLVESRSQFKLALREINAAGVCQSAQTSRMQNTIRKASRCQQSKELFSSYRIRRSSV